jgi:uncharacterized coiled-coil DUF342 family protein
MAIAMNIYKYKEMLEAELKKLNERKKELTQKIDAMRYNCSTGYNEEYVKLIAEASEIYEKMNKWNGLLTQTNEKIKGLAIYEAERDRAYRVMHEAAENHLKSYHEIQSDVAIKGALLGIKNADDVLEQKAKITPKDEDIPQ